MGHLTYGYRLNERGRMMHRLFDSDDLQHGEGQRLGYYDSPDKVPGFKKAQQAEDEAKKATAHTIAPEPPLSGMVHGEKRKPGRPRKA
jgi:hypothetical protein